MDFRVTGITVTAIITSMYALRIFYRVQFSKNYVCILGINPTTYRNILPDLWQNLWEEQHTSHKPWYSEFILLKIFTQLPFFFTLSRALDWVTFNNANTKEEMEALVIPPHVTNIREYSLSVITSHSTDVYTHNFPNRETTITDLWY